MRILKFIGKSIRTEIDASIITYLSLCTASTGRSTSLNLQPQILVADEVFHYNGITWRVQFRALSAASFLFSLVIRNPERVLMNVSPVI